MGGNLIRRKRELVARRGRQGHQTRGFSAALLQLVAFRCSRNRHGKNLGPCEPKPECLSYSPEGRTSECITGPTGYVNGKVESAAP